MATIEQDASKAAVFQRLHPRVYLERFISEGLRPDGRQLDAWRDVSVNVGSISTANGSSLVRIGGTTVVCGVKAEIAEPELDDPQKGFLVPNLDLSAICSPKFKPGPPTEEAQVLSDRLNEVLSSGMLPLESLCIHPGKSAWVLYIDATCVNDDGNVFDAALIAMVAALKNTTLPIATYNEDTCRTTCSSKTMLALDLKRLPIPMSFGIFECANVFPDATSFEEPLLETTISIVMDKENRLSSVSQVGVNIDSHDVLMDCIDAARTRYMFLSKEIYP